MLPVRKMSKEALTVRDAQDSDCYDIWRWRNHAKVRRWCFNKEPISYEQHKAWFEKALKGESLILYIAEIPDNIKVGQVRLEIGSEERAFIHVNLNPDFFGRGFSSIIIKAASRKFMDEYPRVKKIIAEIIGDNVISQKAFAKAGYNFSHTGSRNGTATVIFVFERKV